MSILDHLRSRQLNVALHRPIIADDGESCTFPLWNLSGRMCGYQTYRPGASKERKNDEHGRYYTYRNKDELTVWGLESIRFTPSVLFLAEGIFDACRLTWRRASALAVLSNNPVGLRSWLRTMPQKIVVVRDDDAAGTKLAKYGDVAVVAPGGKDLGDAPDKWVDDLIREHIR